MRPFLTFTMFITSVLSLSQVRTDDAQKEREKLQGSWEVVEFVRFGKPVKNFITKVVFAEDKMKIQESGAIGECVYQFKLDP